MYTYVADVALASTFLFSVILSWCMYVCLSVCKMFYLT